MSAGWSGTAGPSRRWIGSCGDMSHWPPPRSVSRRRRARKAIAPCSFAADIASADRDASQSDRIRLTRRVATAPCTTFVGGPLGNLIGISGSLRRLSFNTALLRAAAASVPDGFTVDVHTVHGIPLYDGDHETQSGIPAAAAELKEAIAGADGLILATPEYNSSIPGVLKNAIDWLSRPPADIKRVFGGKPVALLGASTGAFGTTLAQTAWLPILRRLGMLYWPGDRLLLPNASGAFDAAGT